jgi:hypothetical protein
MADQVALSDPERWKLESFRRAAKQVRDASIIAQGQSIKLHTAPGEAGYVDVFVELLASEQFRSLALAVRLVYQEKEPAHFFSVCKVIERYAPTNLSARVEVIRTQYKAALRASENDIRIGDGRDPDVLMAKDVFESWLYGIAFHQDADRQADVNRLASTGAMFLWSVQATALQIAGRILDLDDVVADFLGETRLPRI